MSVLILCVQRDREACELYSKTLRAEGYEVLPAHDGGQALEILRRDEPDFVALDVYLPRQDGFEILAELRAMPGREQTPVLLLCEGDLTAGLEARAEGLGALGIEAAPLAPEKLLARIRAAVKPDMAVGSVVRSSVPSLPSEGQLRDVPFPELLHRVHRARLDGVLLLEHGSKKKAIEIREGWPVSIKSNLVSECLGSYLVGIGRCTKEQLDQSTLRMKAGEGLQGQILVAMDVLSEDEVVEMIRAHALEKVFEVFGWLDGRFAIRTGARVQRGTSIGLEDHPVTLILEGVKRATRGKLIDRCFEQHREARLRMARDHESSGLEDLALDAADVAWLRRLDGSTPVGALLDEPESRRRVVYALLAAGLLRMDVGAAESSAGSAVDPADDGLDSHGTVFAFDPSDEQRIRAELSERANLQADQDHYGVLGVSSTATDAEIRNAHADLAKQSHPDRYHGASSSVRQLAARVFGRISEAYEAIATAEDRAAYERERSLGRRNAQAEDEGRRALEAETEFQRGEARMAARDYEGALLCFGRSIERFPSEGEYRSHYGWCLYLCHPNNEVMLAEALEHCREGVRLAKDREKPYLLLGRLYKVMGKTVAARKMFTRAVEIRPKCVEAMRELRIMNMRRDKDKGVLKRFFKR